MAPKIVTFAGLKSKMLGKGKNEELRRKDIARKMQRMNRRKPGAWCVKPLCFKLERRKTTSARMPATMLARTPAEMKSWVLSERARNTATLANAEPA